MYPYLIQNLCLKELIKPDLFLPIPKFYDLIRYSTRQFSHLYCLVYIYKFIIHQSYKCPFSSIWIGDFKNINFHPYDSIREPLKYPVCYKHNLFIHPDSVTWNSSVDCLIKLHGYQHTYLQNPKHSLPSTDYSQEERLK